MLKDKFSAVWVSHSSIGDYLKCPRGYFLANLYRDPDTNHKIALLQPALALGQAVHGVIESVSRLPSDMRLSEPLTAIFERDWQKYSGQKGGFKTPEEEQRYKDRGLRMLQNITDHPGPLLRKAVKIRQELPYFWLSEADNIILCGKIDWLEYFPDTDSVAIIDFKTGKFDEDPQSLQLPIYYLLTKNCQKRQVSGVYYWYLDRDHEPVEMLLPDEAEAYKIIFEIAKKISLARKLEHFVCKYHDGCRNCRPLEKVIRGEATQVGVDEYNRDVYVI